MRQKGLLLGGSIASITVTIMALPIISRGYDSATLAKVSIIIMMHSFFGVLDILKPVIIRNISKNDSFANWFNLFIPAVAVGILYFLLIFTALQILLYDFFSTIEAILISSSAFLFVMYNPLWAVLDANYKVGTAFSIRTTSTIILYLLLSINTLSNNIISPAMLLAISTLVCTIIFVIISYPYIGKGKLTIERDFYFSVCHIFVQNLAKTVNDFSDRLFVSATLPPIIIAAYNLNYEIGAKINLPSQLISTYYFPKLCNNEGLSTRFFSNGVFLSFSIFLMTTVLYFWGKPLYVFYLGEIFDNYFFWLISFAYIASTYSLSFFCQAIMRSYGLYTKLSTSFIISSVLGLLLLLFLVPFLKVKGILLALFIFKSPALIMIYHIRNIIGIPLFVSSYLLIMCNLIAIVSVIFNNIS